MKSGTKPRTIDEYLAALSPEKKRALQSLRRSICAAVPEAEECISYGIPAFRLNGKPLIYFGAAANHCALYGAQTRGFEDELKRFDTSGNGTIRFQPEKPLPAGLVRKLVKARMARTAARVTSRQKSASPGK